MTPLFATPRLTLLLTLCVACYAALCSGNVRGENVQHFDNYSVHYTVFNSTFILEDVARTYQIKRSKYESLINISVVPKGEHFGGLPAQLSGTVTNLMQQQKALKFKEINEGDVVYYLAPVRISGEEVVHFDIQLLPENSGKPLSFKFTKKLYSD